MHEVSGMNTLDLPTEAGHHQCGRGGGGSGGGKKKGVRAAKQKNADGKLGRSLARVGINQPTKGLNITRDRGSRVRTG